MTAATTLGPHEVRRDVAAPPDHAPLMGVMLRGRAGHVAVASLGAWHSHPAGVIWVVAGNGRPGEWIRVV